MKRHPYRNALLAWLAIAAGLFLVLRASLGLAEIANALIALNASTFLLYGVDKFQASSGDRRVPERVLWLAAFLGGSVGAITGMHAFRHKTKKLSFQLVLAFLVLLQVAIAYYLIAG